MAGDYGGAPTRYGAMFGTPEMAARTLAGMCASRLLACGTCYEGEWRSCPLKSLCDVTNYPPDEADIANWLHGGYMDKEVRDNLGC